MLVNHTDVLMKLVACQNVGPPYAGWDLAALEERLSEVEDLGVLTNVVDDQQSQELKLIAGFMDGRIPNGWNIIALGKAAQAARAYLSLPSLEDIDPEIRQMTDAVRKNKLGGLFDRFK